MIFNNLLYFGGTWGTTDLQHLFRLTSKPSDFNFGSDKFESVLQTKEFSLFGVIRSRHV